MKFFIALIIAFVSLQLNAQVFNKKDFAANKIPEAGLGRGCIGKAQSIAKSLSSKTKTFSASYWGRNMDAVYEIYQISGDLDNADGICIQIWEDGKGCEVTTLYQNSCDRLKSF